MFVYPRDAGITSLYKYRECRLDYLWTLLVERRIYLPSPKSFNDPWDSHPHFMTDGGDDVYWDRIEQFPAIIAKDMGWDVNEALQNMMPERPRGQEAVRLYNLEFNRKVDEFSRVYSLSAENRNLLLWAHYAANHHGSCWEFDATVEPFSRSLRVLYEVDRTPVDITSESDIYRSGLVKSADWAYEKEYRLFAWRMPGAPLRVIEGNFLEIPPKSLRSIILGARMTKPDKWAVTQMVKAHAPHVLIRQATLHPSRYELVIAPGFDQQT